MSKQLTEFLTFHQSSNFHKTVCTAGLNGKLNTQNRSVSWRILLGLLPPPTGGVKEDPELEAAWLASVAKDRETFGKKLAAYEAQQSNAIGAANAEAEAAAAAKKKKSSGPRFGDDTDSDDDGIEDVTDDPLSNKKDSEWQKKFELQKLIETIDNDLNRLWLGDDEWFEQEEVRGCIRKVLVTYTAETNLSYRQGMHEIAAIVYYWVVQSATEAAAAVEANPGETETAKWLRFLQMICSSESCIADSYAIFHRIMAFDYYQLCCLYDTTRSRQVKDLGESALTGTPTSSAALSNNEGVEMSQHIQCYLIKKENPGLARHLNTVLDISPQSYGIRWLRLMFSRELSIPQSATVWDGLFAGYAWTRRKGQPFEIQNSLIRCVGAGMLLFIGEGLLEEDDYGMCLQRLMKYPPVDSITPIMRTAVKLLEDKELALMIGIQPVPAPVTAAAPSPTTSIRTPTAARAPSATFLPSTTTAGTESVDQLREKQLRMGMILETVVSRMEAKWFSAEDPSKQSAEEKQSMEEDYIMAIAELKKVKDVLLNTIQE